MKQHDLVLRAGLVHDPDTGTGMVADVAVDRGRISAVAPDGIAASGRSEVDATGLLVVPGLVDLHTHVHDGAGFWGVSPASTAWRTGVTTWVDAGSAGAYTMRALRSRAARERVGIHAFVNIAPQGLAARTGEARDAAALDPEALRACVGEHGGFVRGIKVRIDETTVGLQGVEPLLQALTLADDLGLPVMAHVGPPTEYAVAVLQVLRPGDVLTHCAGPVIRAVLESADRDALVSAYRRGVVFDLGHGAGGFDYEALETLLTLGLAPHTVSSDLHALCAPGPAYDLPYVMSKLLAAGMTLPDVLHATTAAPADVLGLSVGRLQVGGAADIGLFRLEERIDRYADVHGVERVGEQRLENVSTFVAGGPLSPHWPSAPPSWVPLTVHQRSALARRDRAARRLLRAPLVPGDQVRSQLPGAPSAEADTRPVRIAALGLYHEANSFAEHHVDRDAFAAGTSVGEAAMRERYVAGSSVMSGYLDVERDDVEVVPLRMTTLTPAGVVVGDVLRREVDALCESLRSRGPWDGVLVAVHGACVADDLADADGYLLTRLRAVAGDDVPLGATLDLHANVSAAMVEAADVLNAYQTNPHVDARTRAVQVAETIVAAARRQVRPTMAWLQVPVVPTIVAQNTDAEPMRSLMRAAAAVEARPGVLAASVTQGYPYADVAEMGMAVVVVTDDDRDAARDACAELAAVLWGRRAELSQSALPPTEAVELVRTKAVATPALLLDAGDNIGAGSAGDSVVLLRAVIDAGLTRAVAIVADPAAVTACTAAGVGGAVRLTIGGTSHPEVGPPLEAAGEVLRLDAGVFRADAPVHAGLDVSDAGPTALARLDTGQLVVLTTRAVMPVSATQVTRLGVDLAELDVVLAKGVHSPLAGYAGHVADHVFVDTPGVTAVDLNRLPYRNRRAPMLPFEDDAVLRIGLP